MCVPLKIIRNCDTKEFNISGGIGLQKTGVDFKKLIVIICDLVEFTVVLRFLDSSKHWVRISMGSLLIFL